MRNFMVATSSPSWSVKSSRLVTKWPRPRPVCLLRRDRVDDGGDLELVAGDQGSLVVLVAVGGHHRGEAGVVEQLHQPVGRAVAWRGAGRPGRLGLQAGPQAPHDPGLEHGGRGDDAGEAGVLGGLVVDVDRVVVPHGLHPVADHRLVDRVGPAGGVHRPTGPRTPAGRSSRSAGVAHRAPRFMPRPAMARISRWISLTPPPKVLIWAWRAARSSSPWRTAPGEPGLR